MTEKKITYALNRIKSCIENGYKLEGLLKSYHLNVELIKFILLSASPDHVIKDKKIKAIVHSFLQEINTNEKLRTTIHKRNIKSLKPWLADMDLFFKNLKVKQPDDIDTLQQDTEKIFGILKISANKLFVKK